jgi:hypothetical protein
MGKFLILCGIIMVVVGLIIQFSGKIPSLGKLPGDIIIKRQNFTFYFPFATSVLISLLISIILILIQKSKQ